VITFGDGRQVPEDVTRAEVVERLGEPAQEIAPVGPKTSCVFYSVGEEGDTLWQFCFRGERQVSSAPVTG
jgi:hypothetical protein